MKQKLIPIVSIVAGVLAFFLTMQYLRGKQRELDLLKQEVYKGATRIRVMAAKRDIPSGTAIKSTDLGTTEVFESNVRGHAVTPDQAEMLFGRKALFTIRAREPIFWSDIEGGAIADAGLAAIVKSGMRAISISASGAAAVSGMVRPNDRIDVIGTFSFPAHDVVGEVETVTLTVLQDVTVLATGQMMAKQLGRDTRGSSGYNTVTLEVTPREAELLIFAQRVKGSLALSLRNSSDVSYEDELPTINFDHLQNKLPELNLYRQRNIRHKRNL